MELPPHQTRLSRRPLRAVVLDDDENTCELLEGVLAREMIETSAYTDPRAGLDRIREHPPHVVLTDLEMGSLGGLEVLRCLGESHPDIPVLVITGHADLDNAVGALRAGAYDFLTKPLDTKRVAHAVRRAGEHFFLTDEVNRLRHRVRERHDFHSIVGTSPAMLSTFELVERVAPTDASVLVAGESGTGKELVARALHARSGRSDGPFVAVNCAALPAILIESVLLGHTKGAFTNARGTRKGLFVAAEGGTLFLDEIGELPLETQPKLLRALQERSVRPVGGDREIAFDARLVSATNRVLLDEVQDGRFREDLFYRVNVVTIDLPPLRDRGTDILALAQHFIERTAERYGKPVAGIAPEVAKLLLAYPWPGNVRELQNCIDRAVALTRFDRIVIDDLPPRVKEHRPERLPIDRDEPESLLTLEELEARYIRRVLSAVDNNKSHAARILGIDRRTLYRKLARSEDDS